MPFKLNLHICGEIERSIEFKTKEEREAYRRGFSRAAELVSADDIYVLNYEDDKPY